MLTAVTTHPYPYGRVIRDSAGRIMDIIEESQASERVKAIQELNVGAYVVSAQDIWPVLETLRPSQRDGEYRLTDSAYQLIHRGLHVESYQIYDTDEIQGKHTAPTWSKRNSSQKRYFPAGARKSRTSPVRYGRLAGSDRRGIYVA
jgi:bifunctional UDP-N-acetylglucosamine pyrophosphorylase/glucosamine-1-phosphate N-acetyltransferase